MRVAWIFFLSCLASTPVWPQSASRQVAVIVDTSNSMNDNDKRRYAIQLSQVISDLVSDQDDLTVIGFPYDGGCSDPADPSLAIRLNPSQRLDFKSRLNRQTTYEGGTHFGAPIRTAAQVLSRNTSRPRMLLIIADSGGLGRCESVLTDELMALRRSGVLLAAINIGSSRGAFDRNPALEFTTAARSPEGLVDAVAQVYQKFLGAKQVQTGRVQQRIEVEIQPYCREAFLVTVADGRIGELNSAAGNPRSRSIDLNFRGGGTVEGLDGREREYRIVRLERPASGNWAFLASQLGSDAAWMLLQDFSIGVRMASPPAGGVGVPTRLELELYDEDTGQAIHDLSHLPGLQVSVEVEGQKLTLRDDGQGGDLKAGDGILSGTAQFGSQGKKEIQARVSSDLLDFNRQLETQVAESRLALEAIGPDSIELGAPDGALLEVRARSAGRTQALQPRFIQAKGEGISLQLSDDGRNGDRQAGDGIFSARWNPDRAGEFPVEYTASGGSAADPLRTRLRVVEYGWRLELVGATSFDLDYPSTVSVRLVPRTAGRTPRQVPQRIDASGDGLSLRLTPDTGSGQPSYSADWTPTQAGGYRVVFRPVGGSPADPLTAELRAVELGWRLESVQPASDTLQVDAPQLLSVRAQPARSRRESRRPPEAVEVTGQGVSLRLVDDGSGGDQQAGDRVYSALWTPDRVGPLRLDYTPLGGSTANSLSRLFEVAGRFAFGPIAPLELGSLQSGQSAESRLDLSQADVRGHYKIGARSDLDQSGVRLEIFDGQQWQELGSQPVQLDASSSRQWPIRISVGSCPQGSTSEQLRHLFLTAAAASGAPSGEQGVPLRVTVIEDSFLECWWPLLALLAATIVTGVLIHGYWWPFRFPPRLGVVLSPEEDMAEGFFHPIRAHKGTGSGFYRHAACFICADFRLSGKSSNALARLRAQGSRVVVKPVNGASLYRRTVDDEWEPLQEAESLARFGDVYRNADGSLFFEIRNG